MVINANRGIISIQSSLDIKNIPYVDGHESNLRNTYGVKVLRQLIPEECRDLSQKPTIFNTWKKF